MTSLSCSVNFEGRPSGWPRFAVILGPATMVSVGYMDPGNWATDLEGGARFGYQLLWVLLLSNLIALLLQGLCVRLGIVSGLNLAEACREHYQKPVAYALWGLSELAIIACDLAEILGSAIALKILFGIPMVWGAVMTGFGVLVLLLLQHSGIRKLEATVAALVLTIGACLALEMFLARPSWNVIASGFVPHLDSASLYIAIGILGATVMPHNLYLHSALVQTRRVGSGHTAKKQAIRYNLVDTALALNIAFLINGAILVLSAATFHQAGVDFRDIEQAHELLAPLLGTSIASVAFAVALLCAGQSSTITGTLAGQVVMEGFLRIRLNPVARGMITRSLAIVPAVMALSVLGDNGTLQLLILSQVILSLQLPFAIVPLIRFTNSKALMGSLNNPLWVRLSGWLAAGLIVLLNGWLVSRTLFNWAEQISAPGLRLLLLLFAIAYGSLLAWIWKAPLVETCGSVEAGAKRPLLWSAT